MRNTDSSLARFGAFRPGRLASVGALFEGQGGVHVCIVRSDLI